jgi:Protein of unknown function (DUF1592)/Protein of unknown function (DUF1588)/Protein of unknown function (DUF1585)/Protein of unknown function (DUF1595)/Protein of unknown function (DUF1587)
MQWQRWVIALGFALASGACSGSIDDQSGLPGGQGSPSAGNPAAAGGSAGRGGDADKNSGSGGAGSGGSNAVPATYDGSESVARRLSRAELDNTLRDLLGDETSPASRSLAEDLYAPYDNDYTSQLASSAYVESLEVFATDVAQRALENAGQRSKLISCTPSSPNDRACFEQVAKNLLGRAFRRPLASDETAPYLALLDLANEPNAQLIGGSAFNTAVALLVRSVIQDPEFLYRIEAGTASSDPRVFTLSDHEIASRMSYLLWGSSPDAGLRAAADAGELRDAKKRRAQAERLLADARAREQLHRFHAMWLGYRAIPQSPQLAAAFARETNALLDRVVFDERQSYLNLFSFDETFVDASLADHYGLPHPSGSTGWVTYGDSGRAGILSHGAVLAAFGKFSDTSPTQRGIFVRTRLMCQELSPPPPSVMADKPPAGDQDAVCKYDRYQAHRTSSSCAGCHNLTDGIGFGLENYDLAGRYRTHDDGLTQCTIEGRGEITGVGAFRGPKELGALLVDQGLLDACVVQQYLQFALGHKPSGRDQAAIDQFTRAFASSDHDFAALIASFVESDAFARRVEPENP